MYQLSFVLVVHLPTFSFTYVYFTVLLNMSQVMRHYSLVKQKNRKTEKHSTTQYKTFSITICNLRKRMREIDNFLLHSVSLIVLRHTLLIPPTPDHLSHHHHCHLSRV